MARKQVLARTRPYYTTHYIPRVSYLDPESNYHNFRGFFTLFWIGLFIMVVTTMLKNIKDIGHPLRVRVRNILMVDIRDMGLSDLAMVITSGLVLPLHQLYRSGPLWLRWSQGGLVVQSVGEIVWLFLWISWSCVRHWTWAAQVLFTLHLLAILMKLHSYAFYNGHLSEVARRVSSLDQSRPLSSDSSATVRANQRRPSMKLNHKDQDGTDATRESLEQLREDLATELTSPLGTISYPRNLNLRNYVDYLFCPTVCYELEYPRCREPRSGKKIASQAMAVLGCIFLLNLISEEFIVPILSEAKAQLQLSSSITDKTVVLAETISMLLFPFMVAIILVFLVIFQYVLGMFAELTRFADRQFYSDWWNSCDWLEFSRKWNIPVHHFLFRHVYLPARSHFSQPVAVGITFLFSSIAHEMIMSCITKKLRGYGFLLMMLQLPITAIQKSWSFRELTTLNNVFFWLSMIFGLSSMCVFYVLV